MVMGCDLKKMSDGEVVTGDETTLTCTQAIQEFHATRGSVGNVLLIATAGKAGRRWGNVTMSWIIKKRLLANHWIEEDDIVIGEASRFNTDGEMKAFAQIAKNFKDFHVIIATKKWHAARCKFWCKYWLKQYGMKDVEVTTTFPSFTNAGEEVIAREYLLSWPFTILKYLLRKLKPPA
jgi:hypothetical protein